MEKLGHGPPGNPGWKLPGAGTTPPPDPAVVVFAPPAPAGPRPALPFPPLPNELKMTVATAPAETPVPRSPPPPDASPPFPPAPPVPGHSCAPSPPLPPNDVEFPAAPPGAWRIEAA